MVHDDHDKIYKKKTKETDTSDLKLLQIDTMEKRQNKRKTQNKSQALSDHFHEEEKGKNKRNSQHKPFDVRREEKEGTKRKRTIISCWQEGAMTANESSEAMEL